MRALSQEKKSQILFLLESGFSTREIAQKCEVSQPMVVKVRKASGLTASGLKGGRPRKITERASREMARLLTSGSVKTPKEAILAIGNDASVWTARRALHRIGLKAIERKKKPALSAKNILARKEFARRYRHWTLADWKQVYLL